MNEERPGLETLAVHAGEPRPRMGVSDALVRVFVGLEAPEDITADFEQALR